MRSLTSSLGYATTPGHVDSCPGASGLSQRSWSSAACEAASCMMSEAELLHMELDYYEQMQWIRTENLGNIAYSNQIVVPPAQLLSSLDSRLLGYETNGQNALNAHTNHSMDASNLRNTNYYALLCKQRASKFALELETLREYNKVKKQQNLFSHFDLGLDSNSSRAQHKQSKQSIQLQHLQQLQQQQCKDLKDLKDLKQAQKMKQKQMKKQMKQQSKNSHQKRTLPMIREIGKSCQESPEQMPRTPTRRISPSSQAFATLPSEPFLFGMASVRSAGATSAASSSSSAAAAPAAPGTPGTFATGSIGSRGLESMASMSRMGGMGGMGDMGGTGGTGNEADGAESEEDVILLARGANTTRNTNINTNTSANANGNGNVNGNGNEMDLEEDDMLAWHPPRQR